MKREEVLREKIEAEGREFESGFWLPDMGDEENIKKLAKWNGEWSSMSTLGFVRVARDGTRRKSIFPPKGLS